MNPVYASVIGVVLTAFRALDWRIEVSGAHHIPATGPGVVATNHVSYLDFIFAGYGVREQRGRRLRFVAKREVFDHAVSGPLMRAMRHIRVDRAGDTDAAMREVRVALGEGDLVGMFPEGTISRSFVPLPFKSGAARMAMTAGAPLIPGAVWGSQRLYTKGRDLSLTRGVVVTVSFGEPIDYDRDEDAAAVTGRLRDAVVDLVDRAQRRYPQTPGAGEQWWLPAHLGGDAPTPEEAERRALAEAARRRERQAGDAR